MKGIILGVVLALFCAALAIRSIPCGAAEGEKLNPVRPKVAVINIEGAIGPATAAYISRSVNEAQKTGAECLVVELNTPGGLLESTMQIVQRFLSSPVPIVVYVTPTGATAASAGCFITLASHIAAMAPATTIGAAHPVQAGGGGFGAEEKKPDDVMKKKLENFAASYIETIAGKRHRNVEWARQSVIESASITEKKALELKVIEVIAADLPDLLRQIDGKAIEGRTLRTAGAEEVEIKRIASEEVFQLLWRPEVMFILMLVAIYGIIGELSSPGAILPGVVGAIALILVLYMSAILPVNIAGLALIGLAILLFITDVFAPTHGVLTFGGIISFFLGAIMLFDRNDPVFRLSLGFIVPAVILTAAFFIFIVGKGLRAQLLPVKTGGASMVGKAVPAVTRIDSSSGKVFIEGEYWNATSPVPVEAGQLVEVLALEGLTLKVRPRN
jgi:membrane-bound serine protease (ClpP class)